MYRLSKLTNSTRVITSHLPGRTSVGIGIWVRVGSRFETKRLSGISHFLEHMLFKGTTHRSTRKIKADVEGVGGLLNAFTGEEATSYFVKILKTQAAKAFDVLSDMVNNALLEQKEHDKERTVILEEIKMYLDLPSHHVHELMGELLWPDQPLGRPISGTAETVGRLAAREIRDYRDRYYHPRNLLISFCGDVTHEHVMEMAGCAFRDRKAKETSRYHTAASRQSKPRFKFLNKKTEQMHFVVGFHGLPRMHADRYKLAVLNVLLGANMSSRLFEEVREKRGLAYEIRSGLSFYEDAGALTISAGVEPKKAVLAIHVIMRELNRLRNGLVSHEELRRAKDYFTGQFHLGLEDTLDHMLWLGDRLMYRDELPDCDEICKEIESVTNAGIRELARNMFRSAGLNLSLIGSYGGQFENQIAKECVCD